MPVLADGKGVQTAHFVDTVEFGLFKTLLLEEFDTLETLFDHFLARSEAKRLRLAGLDASRDAALFETIQTQRALVDALVRRTETRHVKGTSRLAISAAVALVGIKRHHALVGLVERARRADFHTSGVRAVEARAAADGEIQGLKLVAGFMFGKRHDQTRVAVQIRRRLVAAGKRNRVESRGSGQSVPLLAGHLTTLAARAVRSVKQDGDFFTLSHYFLLVSRVRRRVPDSPGTPCIPESTNSDRRRWG